MSAARGKASEKDDASVRQGSDFLNMWTSASAQRRPPPRLLTVLFGAQPNRMVGLNTNSLGIEKAQLAQVEFYSAGD